MNVNWPAPYRELSPRPFVPDPEEVRDTRSILASLGLPTELVLQILDLARYWTEITTESIEHRVLYDERWTLDYTHASAYLWVPLSLNLYADGERPQIREIEFKIVSHDQGWTTEDTRGTYKTSSWFEVSHARPLTHRAIPNRSKRFHNIEEGREFFLNRERVQLLPRNSTEMEPQRTHCREMMKVTWPEGAMGQKQDMNEGTHAWYLQGNQVARAASVFEGEMVKRYRVVWGCAKNPVWEGNEGAGRGEGFIDNLQPGDCILVWARAKRRGWDNHVFGMRVIVRYTL